MLLAREEIGISIGKENTESLKRWLAYGYDWQFLWSEERADEAGSEACG